MDGKVANFTIEMFEHPDGLRIRIFDNQTGEVHEKQCNSSKCTDGLKTANETLRKWCKEKDKGM